MLISIPPVYAISLCLSPLHLAAVPFSNHILLPKNQRNSQTKHIDTAMSTPWTMTWFVRWRVRDWASCFTYSNDHELASSPRMAVRNMASDKKNDNSNIHHHMIYDNKNKLPQPSKKCNKKRQLNNPMIERDNKDGAVPIGNRVDVDDSSWTLCADEDYIVFCFRGDEAFDVIKDSKSVTVKTEAHKGLDRKHKNSSPVNRKLRYDEDAEQVLSDQKDIPEKISNANMQGTDEQNDQDCINTSSIEDEELQERQKHRDSIQRACKINEEIEDRGMESRGSNQSEGSSSSFAFPALGGEWIGSPEQMPKSESVHLRKQKVRSVLFQCWRF